MSISVIICTHNPREDYLRRTLEALQKQTLSIGQWELLLIDNASDDPLAEKWDLSWHPHARILREEELGLTPARLRGIAEAKGEVIVFVDDDNVLHLDYLSNALQLHNEFPQVGVWSGTIIGAFETQPSSCTETFLPYLALSKESKTYYCHDVEKAPLPIGAGMVVTKTVASHYALELRQPSHRRALDRTGGKTLIAGGDTDIGIVGCQSGFACGRSPSLVLTHLIPETRLQIRYLFRLARDVSYSHQVLYALHDLDRAKTSLWRLTKNLCRGALDCGFGLLIVNPERIGKGLCRIAANIGVANGIWLFRSRAPLVRPLVG